MFPTSMKNQRFQQGLTLVETLVSLFILSVAVMGSFALISYNLSTANDVKNSFIASGLAQEGMEVVRNLRDGDWFAAKPFGTFGDASGVAVPDGLYRVQWNSRSLIADVTNPPIKKDASGYYTYTSGTDTIFHREVEIKRVTPTSGPVAEIIVTVRVTWGGHFGNKQIVAEEHLFDWY